MSTSDGRVPLDRPAVARLDVKAGSPVRAQTWADAASLAHWIAGRGTMLVPQHRVNVRLAASGTTTETLRYYVRPGGRALARVWVFEIRGTPLSGPGEVTITPGADPTSAPWIVEPEAFGARMPPIVVVEGAGINAELTRTSTAGEITCDVDCTAGYVDIISCAVWELPRLALENDATDYGIRQDTLFPRRPIADFPYASVAGVADLTYQLGAQRRTRGGHVARWGKPVAVTSGSATALHVAAYPVVPGYDRTGSETIACRVYREASDGTTGGDWRVVTTSGGASSWQAIGVGAGAAWSSAIEVTMTAEDQSTADGEPATLDTLKFEARVTAGAGEIRFYGWSAYEKG